MTGCRRLGNMGSRLTNGQTKMNIQEQNKCGGWWSNGAWSVQELVHARNEVARLARLLDEHNKEREADMLREIADRGVAS